MTDHIPSKTSNDPKFAWAIELRGHSGVYFSPGWRREAKWEWTTTDFGEAVRFVTQGDAHRVILMFRAINSTFFQGLEWVATEHGWLDPLDFPPKKPAPETNEVLERENKAASDFIRGCIEALGIEQPPEGFTVALDALLLQVIGEIESLKGEIVERDELK